MTKLSPIHPGEILLHDFMEPLGVTQRGLATAMSVPPRRINEIVHANRGITADTAIRLDIALGTTSHFWMNLQAQYDLEVAEDKIHEEKVSLMQLEMIPA